jgi:ABC-type lipoprotein release transport system permease subunit
VVRMLFHAEARQRWRSWLLLGLLVALTTGLILAGASAGRRTAAAFPQFVASHGYDAVAYSAKPLPKIADLPEVRSVTALSAPATGVPSCTCTHTIGQEEFNLYVAPTKTLSQFVNLVAGRMPDPSDPHQILASFGLQELGVRVGTVLRVPFYAPSQRTALASGHMAPRGPMLALRVVGIEASEGEFPGSNGDPEKDLYATSALARALSGKTIAFSIYYVRLVHGADDIPKFESDTQALGALGSEDQLASATSVATSIHPQAVGWWILAVLSALVGLVLVAQALARQSLVESETHGVLRALGLARRQIILVGVARTATIGVLGVFGGLALSFFLSRFTPVGEARLAESSRGFVFDSLVAAVGGLATLVILLGIGLLSDLRTTRTESPGRTRVARPSRLVGSLTSAGAPPSVLIGVRRALERGVGRNTVPVGSAMLGSILAVTALCATSVFGASLTHLTTTPGLYGQPFDVWLNLNGPPDVPTPMLAHLERIRGITGITGGIGADVKINGKTVDALAGGPVRGPLLLTSVNGHIPHSDHEIALGATTMRAVHARIGATVTVSAPRPGGGTRTSSYRVVGTTVFPPDFGAGGLGSGAIFTLGGFLDTQCPPGPSQTACGREAYAGGGGSYLLRFARGPHGRAAATSVAKEYAPSISYPVTPANLVNFGEAVNFPLIFGLVLGVFGITTLVHVLVVSVARRRREAGLLRALGFVRRQIAYSVWWQTTTIALVGIVVGVPAGIVAGRAIWQQFARSLGVLPEAVVVTWVIVALAAGTFVVASALAIGPAVAAARSRPASLLRTE